MQGVEKQGWYKSGACKAGAVQGKGTGCSKQGWYKARARAVQSRALQSRIHSLCSWQVIVAHWPKRGSMLRQHGMAEGALGHVLEQMSSHVHSFSHQGASKGILVER